MSETEMISLSIDDRSVQAPKGTTVLEAARLAGIAIPYYCYHPGLSVVASCRMCLVEIEKMPRLQPSCATAVSEGMVVRTQTPETLRNRKSVLEFLLLNHPLDCPVCDQAGECELQNYYLDHGAYASRFNENKTKRKKAFPIGPHVILDQERCILCTRCVRFTREVTGSGELGVIDRGHRSEIAIFPGKTLNNRYSGNVVDICPVGALTDRDFRFQCRVWFLGRSPSICLGCSRGCNIEIHYNERFNARYHDRRVQRLKPRFNRDVNGHWMCDEGRYSYHAIDAPTRLKAPRLKREGSLTETTWEAAVQRTAAELRTALEQGEAGSVAVLASPQMTNEELYRLRSVFRDSLKVGRIEFRVPPVEPAFADDLLITADKNPNTRGAEALELEREGCDALMEACAAGRIRFLYICHHDLTRRYPLARVADALAQVAFVVFQGPWDNETAALADVQLPSAAYAEKEGTFTNCQGRVQRISAALPPAGISLPDLDILSRLARQFDDSFPHARAPEVFGEMSRRVAGFAGMSWESVGSTGQLLGQA